MGKIVASIRNNRSVGATATTLTDDIKFGFNAHALHLDVYGLLIASATDTYQGIVDNVTNVRYSTTTSQPESSIDGDDLFNFMPNIGVPQFITNNALTVDNQPKAFTITQPFSPFPLDDSRVYGLPNGKGVQFEVDWAADGTIDNKSYDLTVEGISETQANPIGYMKFIRDSYTSGAVGEENFTTVNGNRLLGVQNHQGTEYDALAASAASNTVGIREQALLMSDNIVMGPYKSSRSWGMNNGFSPSTRIGTGNNLGSPAGSVLNLGSFFADYGISNTGPLGIAIAGRNTKIRTTAGVAQATRVNPVVLVR